MAEQTKRPPFDGGPAFPYAQYSREFKDADGTMGEVFTAFTGMTLRDYFAIKALAGFAADPTWGGSAETSAAAAYRWADAMLVERSKLK